MPTAAATVPPGVAEALERANFVCTTLTASGGTLRWQPFEGGLIPELASAASAVLTRAWVGSSPWGSQETEERRIRMAADLQLPDVNGCTLRNTAGAVRGVFAWYRQQDCLWLQEVGFDAELHNLGLGTSMWDYACELAAGLGCTTIGCTVHKWNLQGRAFWLKRGLKLAAYQLGAEYEYEHLVMVLDPSAARAHPVLPDVLVAFSPLVYRAQRHHEVSVIKALASSDGLFNGSLRIPPGGPICDYTSGIPAADRIPASEFRLLERQGRSTSHVLEVQGVCYDGRAPSCIAARANTARGLSAVAGRRVLNNARMQKNGVLVAGSRGIPPYAEILWNYNRDTSTDADANDNSDDNSDDDSGLC